MIEPREPPTANNCFYLNKSFFYCHDKETKELFSSLYLPIDSESNFGGNICKNLITDAISDVSILDTLCRVYILAIVP